MNMHDNEEQDDENEFKPKNKAQSNKYNDKYNYDDRPIRANSEMIPKHEHFKNMNRK